MLIVLFLLIYLFICLFIYVYMYLILVKFLVLFLILIIHLICLKLYAMTESQSGQILLGFVAKQQHKQTITRISFKL